MKISKQPDKIKEFENEVTERVSSYSQEKALKKAALNFLNESVRVKYSYNFSWMGRPIIQYPQDMLAMQEIIWNVKPDLIIDIGIAHGGSLIFYSSLLELIGDGHVLGVDIDIRSHNKQAIEEHPMSKRITMIEGSSVSEETIKKVKQFAKKYKRVLVSLDSNHTYEHVKKEMNAYHELVSPGSYLVVFDTIVEDLEYVSNADRSWGKGNNPKTAVTEFLKSHNNFQVDSYIDNKLLISVAPSGYLKKIR